jgi:hypothetical protein
VSAAERWLLHLSTAVATLTGLVYLDMKYAMKSTDPFSALHHPWQPHVLALHLLVGPCVVFSLGLIAREHILARLRDPRPHRSRVSGVAGLALGGPMILSGYLIQIVTNEPVRRALVWVHVLSGSLFALALLAHVVAARPRPGRRRVAAPRSGSRGVARPLLDRAAGRSIK